MLITPFNVKCERDSLLCSLCVVYFYVSDIRRTTVLQRRSRSRLVSLATTHLADEEMAKPTQRERWKGREGTLLTLVSSSLPFLSDISSVLCAAPVQWRTTNLFTAPLTLSFPTHKLILPATRLLHNAVCTLYQTLCACVCVCVRVV